MQIEEGRKFVSSLKINTIGIKLDSASSNDSDTSFQHTNQSSPTGNFDGKYSAPTAPEKSDKSSDIGLSEGQPTAKGKLLYENEIERSSQDEPFMPDGLSRKTGPKVKHRETLSPSLSEVSARYRINQTNSEILKEANVEDVNAEQVATHEAGIEGAPPLAGANVMNVVFVAAECAPWSKTGNNILLVYSGLK